MKLTTTPEAARLITSRFTAVLQFRHGNEYANNFGLLEKTKTEKIEVTSACHFR